MRPTPDVRVIAWLERQPPETLYLTTVSVAEMLYGVARLPDGKKKHRLSSMLQSILDFYGDRVLVFDYQAACSHAAISVATAMVGKKLPAADGYIAAMAAAKGYAVASRDEGPFLAAGLEVINPWD